MGKQQNLGYCLFKERGCDLLSAYWLWDADEPDEEYRVCPQHARAYMEHIANCDEAPCQFKIGRIHSAQEFTPTTAMGYLHA